MLDLKGASTGLIGDRSRGRSGIANKFWAVVVQIADVACLGKGGHKRCPNFDTSVADREFYTSAMSACTTARASRSKPSLGATAALPGPRDNYRRLCVWRRQHVPWLLHSGGTDVFFRLMTASETQPLRISELNLETASGLGARVVIDELHRRGLASISTDPKDGSEHVEATDLLRRLARCYVQMMDHLLRC